jgi:O-antigen ligase
MEPFSFYTYLFLIVSWFLHLPSRIPFLGIIRIDLLLTVLLIFFAFFKKNEVPKTLNTENLVGKRLQILIIYIIVTIPFVEWPGSVIQTGIPRFVKVVVFYYFTIHFITTEKKLKSFLSVFLGCQIFRILEPVYLHLTTGYWGSFASMEGDRLDRLSGGPHDVINPNGLAFVILTVLPFMFYLVFRSGIKGKLFFIGLMPVLFYALILTGSRSGMIGLVIVLFGIVLKNKKMGFIFVSLFFVFMVIGFSYLPENLKDRYLSIVSSDTKSSATAEGRIKGIQNEIQNVVLRRPLVGHGLGTSPEANWHFAGISIRSHNLYVEVAEELGILGLIIFLGFIWSIVKSFQWNNDTKSHSTVEINKYFINLRDSLQVWLLMNLIFSFASYGLTSYEWYLFGGLAAVLQKLSSTQ